MLTQFRLLIGARRVVRVVGTRARISAAVLIRGTGRHLAARRIRRGWWIFVRGIIIAAPAEGY